MLLQQDWEALQRFQAPATQLTEVTQIIRQATACPYCGVMYDSLHAVRKHIGKSHAERGHAKTKQSYADKRVCPLSQTILLLEGIHSPTTGQSSKEAASSFADGALAPERAPASQSDTFAVQLAAPQPTPLFDRVDVQTAARSLSEADLPALIRDEINQCHCPVCRYKCENNMYPARHACKQRPAIARAEAEVRQWVVSSRIQADLKGPSACMSCTLGMWAPATCFSHVETDLRRHVRRADTGNPASSPGASAVGGGVCAEAGQPLLTQLSLPSTGPPSSTGQEIDTQDTEKRAVAESLRKGGRQPRRPGRAGPALPRQSPGLASFRRGGQRPWWKEEGETPAQAGPHTPVYAIRMEISHP